MQECVGKIEIALGGGKLTTVVGDGMTVLLYNAAQLVVTGIGFDVVWLVRVRPVKKGVGSYESFDCEAVHDRSIHDRHIHDRRWFRVQNWDCYRDTIRDRHHILREVGSSG